MSTAAYTSLDDLMMDISTGKHDIDPADFASRLGLAEGWDWDDVAYLVETGQQTVEQVHNAIHAGLR